MREVYDQAAADNIFFLAGGLTFSLLLAALPFLILILSLAGVALAPRIDAPENAVMEWLATIMPVNPATEAQLRAQLASSDLAPGLHLVRVLAPAGELDGSALRRHLDQAVRRAGAAA